ncbi:hypothetical protein [Bergeyella sp. RCAD1439]|uniref:hypothetical protein n=1 Tax=Bergeyella anatis TaxID=3113737 RepID=UPI002E17E58E|nr:hypothetical protein [Bergeyella sp. RCAD1439]
MKKKILFACSFFAFMLQAQDSDTHLKRVALQKQLGKFKTERAQFNASTKTFGLYLG